MTRPSSEPTGASRRRRARRIAVAVVAAVLVSAVSAAGVAAREQPGPVIAAIELRIDQPPERWPLGRAIDFESLIAFAPGEPLTDRAVRRTLSNFYATGLIAEAEVLTRREAAGTIAVVVLRTHTWVDSVVLEGEPGLRKTALLRVIEQQARTPLVEGRLLRSVYALQELYAAHGYRQATVRLEVVPRPARKQVGVVFHLHSGPQALVGRLEIAGEIAPYEPAELLAALRNQPGVPYERQRIAADGERLRSALVDRGHLTATVDSPHEAYDPQTNQVDLTYPVDVGPVIEVAVIGASRKQLKKKGLLPFLGEEVYDEALVARSREQLRSYYQRKGHYRVEVDMREEIREGRVALTIEIDPGPVYQLAVIGFTGNEHFSDQELLELMATSTRSGLSPGGDARLVDEILNDDLDNLHSFYVLQGFSEAEVGPSVVNVGRDKLFLTIPIREGPRRRVVTLTLPGVEALDPGAIRDQLPLRAGGPFHPVLLDDSINLVQALYEDAGYPAVSVTPRLDWNDEGTLVDVELAVGEAQRAVVDRVIVRGNRHTQPEVVRRFTGLEPGDPISRRRLLKAERDLYRLGIFSRVDVEPGPVSEPTGRRDVVVRLDEGRRWRLGYGVSYHSGEGFGGLLSVSRANLGGRGDRLQLDMRGNNRDHRFRLVFDQPSLGGRWKVPITYTLFQQQEERESFTVDDLGAQIALTKELDSLRLGLAYQYRLVEPSGNLPEIPREFREREISSFTPNLFIDHRDDPLDPQRGWSTAVQLEYAFPWINATAEFVKLFVQQTHYIGLGRFGVVATSVRLGAIEPLDPDAEPDPWIPPELASSRIPVSERFFAGGRTTHRAYERDQLGIEGETLIDIEGQRVEVGGNGLFLVNLDYRFPITESFGGTIFLDLGNVWADWRDLDTAYVKPGIGFGLRYLSLVGPVRLEVGWKLDAEPWEEDPVFFLSFGNPF